MTYSIGDHCIRRGDRLHRHIRTLITLTSAVWLSLGVLRFGAASLGGRASNIAVEARQAPVMAVLPIYDPMYAVAHGLEVGDIDLSFEARTPPPSGPNIARLGAKAHAATVPLFEKIGTLVFTTFYEEWRPEFESRWSADISRWPPLFAFARRLRDFLVHKEGEVAFRSPNAAPVSWGAISYSPADNGRKILGADLLLPDILVLMLDLDAEMTALGLPS